MSDSEFDRWVERFRPVVGQTDFEAAALDAGIEMWDSGPPGGADDRVAEGRAGMLDPRTGQGLVTAAFAPAAAPPADYPPGWPFLPFVQAWLAEIRLAEARSLWTLTWSEVLDPPAAAERVAAWLAGAGWERHDRPDVAAGLAAAMGGTVAGVFRRGGRVRLLIHPPADADGSERLLMLIDLSPKAVSPASARRRTWR